MPQDQSKFFKIKSQSDNLLLRYMKQAYHAMRKPSEDDDKEKTLLNVQNVIELPTLSKIDTKKKFELIEKDYVKNFLVPSCCSPLPGDDVFGFITDMEEVEVHKSSCLVGVKLKSHYGDRVIEVIWGDFKQYSFNSSISFTGIDKQGILNRIISKVSEDSTIKIKGLNISSKDGIFEGQMDISVHSVKDVQYLCSIITKVDGINTVHRSTT